MLHHPPLGSPTRQMKLSSSRLRLQMKLTFSWKCYCNRNEIMQTRKLTHLHSEWSKFVNVCQKLFSLPWQRVEQTETQWDLHESLHPHPASSEGEKDLPPCHDCRDPISISDDEKINNHRELSIQEYEKRSQRNTKSISNDKYTLCITINSFSSAHEPTWTIWFNQVSVHAKIQV